MKGQANKDKLQQRFPKKNSTKKIKRDKIFRMKNMEPDAATAGMKNRVGQQVVQVYQHSRQQDEVVALPLFFVIAVRNKRREQQVKRVMDQGLKHAAKVSTAGVSKMPFLKSFI